MKHMEYRGWDLKECKFVRNFVVTETGAPSTMDGSDEIGRLLNNYYESKGDDMWGDYAVLDFTNWYGIENIEINISTGSEDKYAKTIFENDVVLYKDEYYQVKFENGSFVLKNDNNHVWWPELKEHDIDLKCQCVVVGNIYEQRKTKLNILNNLK